MLILVQVKAEYTLGHLRGLLAVGCFGVGQWTFWVLHLVPSHYFPFHYPPQSALGRFLLPFSMAHILHIIMGHPVVPQEDLLLVLLSIPPEAATELVHPQ